MRERLRGWPQVALVALDAEQELPFEGEFDAILVDVPCSGTGTLARNPEIRWRLRPQDLADLQARQIAILRNAVGRLRRGGRLVYSTCSLEAEENEQVVEAAMREQPELRLVRGEAALARHLRRSEAAERPESESPAVRLFDERGCLRTWPQRHGTDGFYAVVMERE